MHVDDLGGATEAAADVEALALREALEQHDAGPGPLEVRHGGVEEQLAESRAVQLRLDGHARDPRVVGVRLVRAAATSTSKSQSRARISSSGGVVGSTWAQTKHAPYGEIRMTPTSTSREERAEVHRGVVEGLDGVEVMGVDPAPEGVGPEHADDELLVEERTRGQRRRGRPLVAADLADARLDAHPALVAAR